MTLKLAIVGTSHVAAIYKAWEQIAGDFPQLEIEFFAAPRDLFRHFELGQDGLFGILDRTLFTPKDIHLMMNTFGSLTVDLSQYDAVLHVGVMSQETNLMELLAGFSIDGFREVSDLPRMSRAAYDACVQGLAEKTRLPAVWHNWNGPYLYTLPAPRVAETCMNNDHPDYIGWRAVVSTSEPALVVEVLEDYSARMVADHAAHGICTFLPPSDVFAANGLTKAALSMGATSLSDDEPYPDDNNRHMNVDYGKIVLDYVLKGLQEDFYSRA